MILPALAATSLGQLHRFFRFAGLISEGLHVIELWNDVNDFILFGKGGEFATHRRESQALTVLSLHLLQNCMVYINTLMIQQVLAEPALLKTLVPAGSRALTLLIFNRPKQLLSYSIAQGEGVIFERGHGETEKEGR